MTAIRADDRGFAQVNYVVAFSVWADFSLGPGVLEQTQDRGAYKRQVEFDIRYRDDITPSPEMRVVWRSRTFEIEAVQPERVLGRMTVRCVEESAA